MDFNTFLSKTNPNKPPALVLGLDPGETTGYSIFVEGKLDSAGQLPTHYIKTGIPELHKFFQTLEAYGEEPRVVFEDYRIYSWKTDQHTWASLHTPQLLGVIETLCYMRGWKTRRQMAQQPKQFCTDDKLKQWGFYRKGEKHARDAIRHACYYLLFNNTPAKS